MKLLHPTQEIAAQHYAEHVGKPFYDNLINFFNDIISSNFAPEITKNIYFCAKTPQEAVEYLKNYKQEDVQYLNKKINIAR